MPDMTDIQNELMDMITKDESPSQISDRIKDMLFAKSADKVGDVEPEEVADVAAAEISGEAAAEREAESEVGEEE